MEALVDVNEPLILLAICAEPDINVLDVEPASTSLSLIDIEELSAVKLSAVTLPLTVIAVSYTHLTLPTICSV